MKRTQIIRRTSMPRGKSRLRHRSPTNSRPHENLAARNEYRQSHSRCLLCGGSAEHIHHVFGGNRARIDVAANLAALCSTCHRRMHEQPSAGRIECLYRKQLIGEFDPAAIDAIGGERIAGWLSRHRPGAASGWLCHAWFRLSEECEK